MSYFRLFDLPLDLLELLTLYFEGSEAVKILTASSNFHEIFARSVWHTITRRTIDVAELIRSHAYARYGHLVRSIQLSREFYIELGLYNWAQLFPNVTSMGLGIVYDMEDVVTQMFMDAIADLHGLRSLEIDMDSNVPPFDLETLARMSVARHRDPIQMGILGPHFTDVPSFSAVEDEEDECMALHNRQFFSPSDTRDDPLVFAIKLRKVRTQLSKHCLSKNGPN
ncbi:hypothetical protein GQ42DRAFT_152907 [Ramicandelaber brevisporus]|nr:hypothetical protein GQ42DRAFT_152907 [Ramicandelaber brevisporus]